METAMGNLQILMERYYDNPRQPRARRNAVEALRRMGNVYLTYGLDYRLAYKNLMLALQIAEEDKLTDQLPYIHLSLSNLYNVNTTTSNAELLRPLTISSLEKSLETAMESDNGNVMASAVENMLLTSFYDSTFKEAYKPALEKFKNYRFKSPSDSERLARILIEGMEQFRDGNGDSAVTTIAKALPYVGDDTFAYRSEYVINLIMINILEESGQYEKALKIAKDNLDRSRKEGHSDYELAFCSTLSNLYEMAEIPDSAKKYYSEYLAINKMQEDNASRHGIETMRFMTEMERVNEQLESLSLQKQRQRQLLIVLICCIIVIAVVLVSVIYVHRRLQRKNRKLFQQFEAMTRHEEISDRLIRDLKSENNRLKEQIDELKKPEEPVAADKKPEEPDENMTQLYNRIVAEVDASEEIYTPGFNLDSLAKKVKAQSRDVSKAINLIRNCNFNQFINEYRVKRACRMMRMPENDGFTIESIAESVGLMSRTSFAAMFKRVTGLTPTEYWKLARKNRVIDEADDTDLNTP